MVKKTIFWFRQDLRLSDNPGLYEAAKDGSVMPIYIWDDSIPNNYKIGRVSKWWLYHSLSELNKNLNYNLNVYLGDPKEVILKLTADHNIHSVYWNRGYDPWRIKVDSEIKALLKTRNIDCQSFNASLLWEPWEVVKNDNMPYKIFTPFYKKGCMQAKPPREPLRRPENLNLIHDSINPTNIAELKLLLVDKSRSYLENFWQVGEKYAQERLTTFLDSSLSNDKDRQNFPAEESTSRLSPYLHFGEISPNQIWYRIQHLNFINSTLSDGKGDFLSELGWREFSYYMLYHFPNLPSQNFQRKFDQFPWQFDSRFLEAWQMGRTGYPIIDAGMRELQETGYIHNRVRMIVGSFLTKNRLQDWRHGADWFWDGLVDADLANNCASWQWIAGTGADAAPYFRIFNPVTQGEKFDPEGIYTKRFIPELNNMPINYLFRPWESPERILKEAGVMLGVNYPTPIVEVALSRKHALNAFASLSK